MTLIETGVARGANSEILGDCLDHRPSGAALLNLGPCRNRSLRAAHSLVRSCVPSQFWAQVTLAVPGLSHHAAGMYKYPA
jgi:hypothetical protein